MPSSGSATKTRPARATRRSASPPRRASVASGWRAGDHARRAPPRSRDPPRSRSRSCPSTPTRARRAASAPCAHDLGAARRRGDARREQRARIARPSAARCAVRSRFLATRQTRSLRSRAWHASSAGSSPPGELHIGNYLGAVKNWVALQHTAESFFCIVDYHAIIAAVRAGRSFAPAGARWRSGCSRPGLDPAVSHAVRAVGRAGTYRAGVDLQHRHAAGRARAADAVQGQVAAAGERERGPAQLSDPAGGGHPAVSRRPRAGGRGPGAAPRAVARDRAAVERAVRARRGLLPRAAAAAHADAAHHGTRRPGEDVEVDGQHHRPARVARGDLGEAAAGGDRSRSGSRRRIPGRRRCATSITCTRRSVRRRRWSTSRCSAAPPAGAASTARRCCAESMETELVQQSALGGGGAPFKPRIAR